MHITSTLSAGFLNFLLMHFLDYNNVGGVRWTSISELCIIEMNPLLAPHANTITQPNHFSFALDYDTVSSSYLETASRINRRQIDPHNNSLWSLWRERWNKPSWNGAPPPYPTSIHCSIICFQGHAHIRQLPAHTWCAGTCTSLPAMRALPLLLPCPCSCHESLKSRTQQWIATMWLKTCVAPQWNS